MSEFTRSNIRVLRTRLERALEEIAEDYGITFEVGSMRFNADECSTKITAHNAEDMSDVRREQFDGNCFVLGIKPEAYGATFQSRGKTYKITGLKPRSPKFPVIAEDVRSGSSYKFPLRAIGSDLLAETRWAS